MYSSLKRRLKAIPNEKRNKSEIQEIHVQPKRDSLQFSTKSREFFNYIILEEKLTNELTLIHAKLEQISSEILTSNQKVENVKAIVDEMKKNEL